jgi:hypothetical protein
VFILSLISIELEFFGDFFVELFATSGLEGA